MAQATTRIGRLEEAAERASEKAAKARQAADAAADTARRKRQELRAAVKKQQAWKRNASLRALGLMIGNFIRKRPDQQAQWIAWAENSEALSSRTAALVREALEDQRFDFVDHSLDASGGSQKTLSDVR